MELVKSRKNIDRLDRELLKILSKRIKLVLKVAQYKKEKGMVLKHPEREKKIVERNRAIAKELGISEDFVESVFRTIIKESLKLEEIFQGQKSKTY